MTISVFHSICLEALRDYMTDPWRWPRENDLVIDLVVNIRTRLSPSMVDAKLSGPGFNRRLIDMPMSRRQVRRVRTEVKIVEEIPSESEDRLEDTAEDGGKARDRVDICVLAEAHPVDIILYDKGARDVVLAVRASDVVGLLEVKLYSDLYIDHGYCGWLDDLVKLSKIAKYAARGVLFVDTAMPLDSVGINYRRRRSEGDRLGRPGGHLPPWPLYTGQDFEVAYQGQDGDHRTISFQHVSEPDSVGPYLWALAVRSTAPWRPDFNSNVSMLLPNDDVVPSCWKVSMQVRE